MTPQLAIPPRTKSEAANDELRHIIRDLDALAKAADKRHERFVTLRGESSPALFHTVRQLRALKTHVEMELAMMSDARSKRVGE